MKQKTFYGIVPCILEPKPNGVVKKFMHLVNEPETKKQYTNLLREMGVKPDTASIKLREIKWSKKNVDEILEEL